MPKTSDYTKCQIYKIVCKDLSIKDLYVGSTCNWTKRKSKHKRSVENKNDGEFQYKKALFIREHGGWKNWEMILIENYPCENDLQARTKEREWYEKLGATLNSICPIITSDELKIQKYENGKIYREENKDIISENKKKYREENKDAISEKMNDYYKKNSDKWLAKIICACGAEFCKSSERKHLKSKKHLNFKN